MYIYVKILVYIQCSMYNNIPISEVGCYFIRTNMCMY